MMNPRHFSAMLATLSLALTASPAEWQWAVDTGVKEHGKAFLWIPPECEYVRGLVVGQQVILEQPALEDPQVRAAATRVNLGILFFVPGVIAYDGFGPDSRGEENYSRIARELADISGYGEIAHAPFLGIGHSGGALPVWRMGYWKPERCFGIIGLRAAPIGPPKHDHKARAEGVPILVITGQYETWNPKQSSEHHWRWCRGDILAMRAKWDQCLASVLVHPGAGHFNWDDKLAGHVAMFIEKAARYRIPRQPAPAGEEPKLNDLTLESGWLTDHTLTPPVNFLTAAYKDYKGDPSMAFWHLDEELARANEEFCQTKGKKLQLVTVLDNGKKLKSAWMQSIELQPEKDGITMRVRADFVDETPVQFASPGQPYEIGHADGPIKFRLIGSWGGGGEQVGPDMVRIKFDRFTIASRRPGLMFMAYHPGNEEYAYAEQSCSIRFPKVNRKGKDQTITFAELADQKLGAKEIELHATSDAGLPVRFCVIAGPAKVEGSKLIFTRAPPRAKFPIGVTVAAYQWGRSTEPMVQSAECVERSFSITE